jgi:hypothetical protein
MTEQQKEVEQEVLDAFTKALNAGVDPDALMRSIIRKGIEVVRGKERSIQAEAST